MTRFQQLTPMLWTEHFADTLDFYTQKLGFTCGERNDDWGWASLHRDEAEIMFAKPNAHVSYDKIGFTGSLYFSVTDVDALWQQWKDIAEVLYPLEDFEYGMREFAISDNNGYILQFGQEIS